MKRLLCILIAAAAILTLCACGKTLAPTNASSSGMTGSRLYMLADRGAGQMYYKVLELHPDVDFDGAGDPMDGRYAEFLDSCPSLPAGYEEWTNAEAEEYLRGRTFYFERLYTASQISRFNELRLTTGDLHTLLNKSFDVEEIVRLSFDEVSAVLANGHE